MKSPCVLWSAKSLVVRIGIVLVAAACVGCGTSKYPVKGRVVFEDGKDAVELAGGIVELQTNDIHPPIVPRGVIRPDATFVLGTDSDSDGVPAARYRAIVTPQIADIDESKPLPPPVLDPKFQRYETSGLEVIVEAKANDITLKVERIKPQ